MIYQVLIRLLSPLVIIFTLLDGIKRQAERSFLFKRFGFFLPKFKDSNNRIWIHCASVGEVKAVEPLIKAIKSQYDVLVTTNTATGKQLLESLFQQEIQHAYCPLDYPFAINAFLKRTKPKQLWVVETEIWPNLYRLANKQSIPIHIINGRLSPKTLQAPAWLQQSYLKSLHYVKQVLARSQSDAERFIQLGAFTDKVSVMGNLKFAQLQQIKSNPNPINREYVLVASTHSNEELQIAQAWLELNRPELLVIVPRHPNRSASIQASLKNITGQFKVASLKEHATEKTSIYLDDRLGQLIPLFEHAKLVIMGGSFVEVGGHNILEPALFKRPIITGPYMANFSDELELLTAYQGIVQVANLAELKTQLITLIDTPSQAIKMGDNAFQAIQTQQNVLQNYLEKLEIN
ncbi:MAG: glycosyltransferase N-terminal domain-containing protein [Pseudomonadota bacterium]|nr:glycosyltransferase N-terminal domain-containing protein [Pseudomonadota bacterium]